MTSTNIFSGIEGNPRNSSRVLRPPGGSTTDVLGLTTAAPEPVRKDNGRNASQITAGTNTGGMQETPKPATPVKVTTPIETKEAPQQPRSRVPPGGHSSGFW